MKKLVFVFLLLIGIGFQGFSQANFNQDTIGFTGGVQAGLSMMAGATGTGLPVNFLYKFYRGGFLEPAYLKSVQGKLGDINMMGGSGRNRINFSFDTDSALLKKTGLVLGLAYEEHWNSSAIFSSDIFQLLFFGNDNYENKSSRLDPAWFRIFNYRQFSLEFAYQKRVKNLRHSIQGQVNYLQGKQFSEIEIVRGNFYTSTYGTRVDADLKGSYFQSDTARNGLNRFDKGNGSGAGFSFVYSLQGPKTKIFIGVKDAGYILWNANTLLLTADTTVHLKGYQVMSLKDISDSLFTLSVDSLRNIGPQSRNKKYRMLLPGKFFFESQHLLKNQRYSIIAGFRYFADPAYLPLFYAGFVQSACWGGTLRTTLGYGGFTKVNLGIEYSRMFFKHFWLNLAVNQAEGIFHPLNPRGFGGFVGLRYQ